MLQIKNITPNKLINRPMILDENSKETVSFEIEGNENIDSCQLWFNTSNSFLDLRVDNIFWDGKIYDNKDKDVTSLLTERLKYLEKLPSLPEKIKIGISYTLFIDANKLQKTNLITKIKAEIKIPFKFYITKKDSSSGSNYYYRSVYKLLDDKIYNLSIIIEGNLEYKENKFYYNDNELKLNDKGEIELSKTEDKIDITDFTTEIFSGKCQRILHERSQNDVVINDVVILSKSQYFSKVEIWDKYNFGEWEQPSTSSSSYDLNDTSTGLIIYFLNSEDYFPKVQSDNSLIQFYYEFKLIDKEYQSSFGKNNPFSFVFQKEEFLENRFFILLKKDEKNLYQSPLISYDILKHPVVSKLGIIFERTFQDYDYHLSFYYDESNQFPMLWYQVKIYNITEENKIVIYDTDKVFTSINQVSLRPIHLLPNEKYQYEIQISDTQNMTSTYISDKILETSKAKEEINFSEQSIKKYLSESFIKLELNKFGIYQQAIYPGITLFPEKSELYPKDNIAIPSEYQKLKLLREDLVSKQAIWINEKEWTNKEPSYFIYDYGIKANTPYNYWAYTIDENGALSGVKINSEPIIAEWDRWTLITADKDPKNEKVYHVDKVFTFEMNLSSGSMTNGTNITTSKNFTEFPVIQKDKSNFYSGSLAALMGVRKWGSTAEDFEQTPLMLEELKSLSTNYQPKFLKDRSGHLWRVEINGAIQVANTDNLATIDLKTMTVPWVQIGEADDISLIYTGTEKKEDLYC